MQQPITFPSGKTILTPILDLQEEREQLEEEVRQLRAAVQVYTAVVRRLQSEAGNPLRAA